MKGADHHTSRRRTGVGGYNGSASSGALESPDTPSSARMPQELAYLVHGVLPYAAILQSAPPEEHYSLYPGARFRPVCTRKQRLRGCLRVILPKNRRVHRTRCPLSHARHPTIYHIFIV